MEVSEIIRRAIEIGKSNGEITFAQVNELCPPDQNPEVVERLFEALHDQGINVVEP
jgi:hypothetical protein